jgi:hypothetical protein
MSTATVERETYIVPTEFTHRGFFYKQVHRDGPYSIYEQLGGKNGHLLAWEVARIRTYPADVPTFKRFKGDEYYPGDSAWGIHGKTVSGSDSRGINHAFELLNEFKRSDEASAQQKADDLANGIVRTRRGRRPKAK